MDWDVGCFWEVKTVLVLSYLKKRTAENEEQYSPVSLFFRKDSSQESSEHVMSSNNKDKDSLI